VFVLQPGDRDELPPARIPLLRLTQDAAQDTVEPGADLGGVTELVEPQPGTPTGLLNRVLGVRQRPGSPGRESEQAIQVGQYEGVEARVTVLQRSGNGRSPSGKRTYCR
jgi:hypothetical protein